MATVLCQQWEESERGWGVRPDGYSLHLTQEDRDAFVKNHKAHQLKIYGSEAPDEYDRPCGEPYKVKVTGKTLDKLKASKNGIRKFGPAPKGGGPWRSV